MMKHNFKPYYAVIFTSLKKEDDKGYDEMAAQMVQLAKQQHGFLGVESARNIIGITVSYWESLEAIASWKKHAAHQIAQRKGKTDWYKQYSVKICRVEREYSFTEK